jgi:hypothetical protein
MSAQLDFKEKTESVARVRSRTIRKHLTASNAYLLPIKDWLTD